MKIDLELPAWTDERNIYVMAGLELVARRHKDGPWEIKTSRCNMCGKCCADLGRGHPFPVIDGQCVHLKKEPGDNQLWLCGLGENRPFGCSVCAPTDEFCTIEFETVE